MRSRTVSVVDRGNENRIFLVAPHSSTRDEMETLLREDGFDPLTMATGAEALSGNNRILVVAAIIDAQLPDMSGFSLCRKMRQIDPRLPIVMIGDGDSEADVLLALEGMGADDYLVKARTGTRELCVRLRASMRRAQEAEELAPTELRFGSLSILLEERRVMRGSTELLITATEFDLLAFLAVHAGQVVSRERILNQVWGYESNRETRTIDVHICNVRKKIEQDGDKFINTVESIGYRFTPPRVGEAILN